MDQMIPESYKRYGNYVNSSRAFPLIDDGLKPAERRILLTAQIVANNKLVKSARIDGTCTARFHPHGSVYGTIVQLVKNGHLIGQGNFGNNLGVEPSPAAAMRYTECMLPKFTHNLAFKYLDYVPWVEGELENEPSFLPAMFPFCLMGSEYTQGIGFGFRTFIPCYTLEDLMKRLMWLIQPDKKKPTIVPISDCKVLATEDDLEQLLTTGKASIKVEGVIVIDKKNCRARVKSWPPGRRFESFLTRFKKELDNYDIGFIDQSNGEVGTAIDFTVLKTRNRDKIFTDFVKKLKIVSKGSVSFEIIAVDLNNNVRLTSVDDMLRAAFYNFATTNTVMLNHKISKNSELMIQLQNLEKIKKPLSEVLSKGKFTKDNLHLHIAYIAKQSKLKDEVVKDLLTKYRIHRLFTVDTDVTDLVENEKELQHNLKNVDEYVLNQYTELS